MVKVKVVAYVVGELEHMMNTQDIKPEDIIKVQEIETTQRNGGYIIFFNVKK